MRLESTWLAFLVDPMKHGQCQAVCQRQVTKRLVRSTSRLLKPCLLAGNARSEGEVFEFFGHTGGFVKGKERIEGLHGALGGGGHPQLRHGPGLRVVRRIVQHAHELGQLPCLLGASHARQHGVKVGQFRNDFASIHRRCPLEVVLDGKLRQG